MASKLQIPEESHISVTKQLISPECPNLFGKRNLIQKILDQSKRTEESTDKSSQQSSDKNQKSNYIICHFEIPAADHCLKGTNRTGTCGPGAGIAVQPRNTYIFQFSGINLSSHKSGNMTVCKRRPQCLNPMPRPLVYFYLLIIQFQYTPYRYLLLL